MHDFYDHDYDDYDEILVKAWLAYQISTRLQLYTILYKIKSTIK